MKSAYQGCVPAAVRLKRRERARRYVEKARECEIRAGAVEDDELKRQFLELARLWHEIAKKFAE